MAPSLRLHQDNLGIWGERRSSAQPAPPPPCDSVGGGKPGLCVLCKSPRQGESDPPTPLVPPQLVTA